MKHLKKFTSTLLVVLLLVTVVFSLVACNKNKGNNNTPPQDTRNNYCESLEAIVIPVLNSSWTANMSDDQIAALDTAGEYVVASSWVSIIKDIVYSSSLQTEKIGAVVEYLNTDDGKAMLADFSKNGANILDLFEAIGLTNEDISNLIYDVLYTIVDKSDSILSDMIARITTIKSNSNTTDTSIDNLQTYLSNLNQAKTDFVPTELEKADFLTAIEKSKSGIADLVKFAYSISLGALTDNILSMIESGEGALTDLDNSEIIAVINAISNNVIELKASLTQEKIDNINATLTLIMTKFDNPTSTSLVFSQIVSYAKTAYLIVDAIPQICDVIDSFTSSIDENFINIIKDYVVYLDAYKNGESTDEILVANTSIVAAKFISSALTNLGEEKLSTLISTLYQKATSSDDYQKAFPLYCVDILANISAVLTNLVMKSETIETAHPTIITKSVLQDVINLTFGLNNTLTKFKEAYRTDNMNGDTTYTESKKIAVSLATYVDNQYAVNQPVLWYTTFVNGTIDYLNTRSEAVVSLVKQDLEAFVNDYFEEGSTIKTNMEDLANDALLAKDAEDTAVELVTTKSNNAGVFYPVYLLLAILGI